MKRKHLISGLLAVLVTLFLFCTGVELDNPVDPQGTNYKGDEAAADDDNNGIANWFEPGYDKEPPVIVLFPPENPAYVVEGDFATLEKYTNPGCKVSDNKTPQKVLEGWVQRSSNVSILSPGEYTITYSVKDSAELSASVSRTVIVTAKDQIDNIPPNLYLTGDSVITIELNKPYVEKGATATDHPDGILTDSIKITGTVNVTKVGTYTLTYTVRDKAGNSVSKTRTVIVVDALQPKNVSPVVTLIGSKDTTFAVGGTYVERGATAKDSVSSNLQVSISRIPAFDPSKPIMDPGVYKIMYTATNSVGSGSATRTLTVYGDCDDDFDPPVISLTGGASVNHPQGTPWSEPGWSVSDLVSEVVKLPVEGTVDVNTPGTYTLTYSAMDLCNNKATKTRTVTVKAAAATPVITLAGKNPDTIYVGTTYNDLKGTAVPNVPVTVKSTNLNVSVAGTYQIVYSAVNDGVEGTATRTVVVTAGTGETALLIKYGVPRTTGITTVSNAALKNITVDGSGGPNLTGRTLTVNFDPYGFHQFSLSDPWIDLKSMQTNTFAQPQPKITFTGTGIPNLDGEYFVNYTDGEWIMVRTDGSFAIVCAP